MRNFLFVLFLFPYFVFSQSSVAIKSGGLMSWVSNYDIPKLTPNIGVMYLYNFGKFQVSIEPSFRKCIKKDYYYDLNKIKIGEGGLRVSYFEMPITFGWMPINKKIIFAVNGGFTPGYISYAHNKYTLGNINKDINLIPYISRFNLDIIGGAKAGVRFNDKNYLCLNARFGRDFLGFFSINHFDFNYITLFAEFGYTF